MSSPHCHSNQRSWFEHTNWNYNHQSLKVDIHRHSWELAPSSVVVHLVVNFKTSPAVDRVDRRLKKRRLLLLRDRPKRRCCAAALRPGMNVMKSSRWADGFGQILSDCYTVDTDKWERGFMGRAAVKPPRAARRQVKKRTRVFYRLQPTRGKE